MYFQRLRDLREDKDMNQSQIAELLHTSQTVYSRYEHGFQTIPVEHLLILFILDRVGFFVVFRAINLVAVILIVNDINYYT